MSTSAGPCCPGADAWDEEKRFDQRLTKWLARMRRKRVSALYTLTLLHTLVSHELRVTLGRPNSSRSRVTHWFLSRRLNGQQLVPGMPAEVFVQTGSRSMMSYVFEPIGEQMRRAFVEQ